MTNQPRIYNGDRTVCSIAGVWKTRKQGNGTPLQYSCLENPMDGGAWWAAVHEVAKSRTRLSDFTFTFHFHALEKEMATHSSVLAWRIPGTEEPGRRLSMGSHRVGHDSSDLAAAAATAATRKSSNEDHNLIPLQIQSYRNELMPLTPPGLEGSTMAVPEPWPVPHLLFDTDGILLGG